MNSHLFSDVRLSGKKSYMNLLVFSMLAGIFIYLTLISQQLTNHYDGLWIGPWFEAGSFPLAAGFCCLWTDSVWDMRLIRLILTWLSFLFL